MEIEHFVVRARQFDNNEPNKTTANKLALELAAHLNFLTTTDIGRDRQKEHANAAFRVIAMLGIRLGLDDDDLELGLHSPAAAEPILVQAGFECLVATSAAVSDKKQALRNWLHAVAMLKAVLVYRNIDFNKSLTDFLIFV